MLKTVALVTQTAWLEIDSWVAANMEKKRSSGLLLLDMSAAFNLVPKEILIPKLIQLGLSEEAAKLIESYMTGRKNACKIQDKVSDFKEVRTGIGEGSVLGPLVFLVCIIETSMIAELVKEELQRICPRAHLDVDLSTVNFADDTTVLVSASSDTNLETAMNVSSDEFFKYFKVKGMKMNKMKEEHITFMARVATKELPNGINVNCRKEAQTVKLLGVNVSQGYTFVNHCTVAG